MDLAQLRLALRIRAQRLPYNAQQLRYNAQQNHSYHVVWLLGVLPLPVLHYARIWRQHRPRSWRLFARAVVVQLVQLLARLLRIFLKSVLIIYTNLFLTLPYDMVAKYPLTNEIITFVFRASKPMMARHRQIVANDGDIFYFMDEPSANKGFWSVFKVTWYNFYAHHLLTSCHQRLGKNVTSGNCELITDSLLFRFSSVIASWLGHDPDSTGVTVWVMVLMAIYLFIGDLILFHVCMVFFVGLFRRISQYRAVVANTIRIVWGARKEVV